MNTIHCKINGREVSCEAGTTILDAAKQSGIEIPTLCYLKDINKLGACRLCVVEIEGMPRLMPSCVTPVRDGMVIHSESESVLASRKKTLDLVCKRHRMDCEYCPDYTFCELHAAVRRLGLDERKYAEKYHERNADESSPCIVRDPSKCIRCRRCVATCKKQGVEAISALFRADKTVTGAQVPMSETNCVGCGQCVKNCPTGALFIKDDTNLLWRALNNQKRIILGIEPETAFNIGKFFGEQGEQNEFKRLATVCKKAGAAEVFDLTGLVSLALPEAAEAIAERLRKGEKNLLISASAASGKHYETEPGFTACRSGEDLFYEKASELCAKEGIPEEEQFLVYVSGCPSGKREHRCDAVLTTTELFQWIQRACVSRFTTLDVWKKAKETEVRRLADVLSVSDDPEKDTILNDQDLIVKLQVLLEEKLQKDITVTLADGFLDCKQKRKEEYDVIYVRPVIGGAQNGGGQFRTHGFQKER